MQSLGTYQDGGLQHNNPASIAQWESRFIWPDKPEPDFALSLGTGTSSALVEHESWWKSRFTFRLFKSLMRTINSEDAWKRFYNSLAPASRPRYHRLNIQFSGAEPSLDDATHIPDLKASVTNTIELDRSPFADVLDSMIASIFYFELDDMPTLHKASYKCEGYIRCRLNLPIEGLRYLYSRLLESSSWFIVQGNPITCVQSLPKCLPPYKRRVTFSVGSIDEKIAISIRGITKKTKLLSGFPTSLGSLITEQKLDSPFGTIDHCCDEKPLPAVPAKRDSPWRTHEHESQGKRSRSCS